MTHTAVYGSLKLKRTYCKRCQGTTLVVGGIKQCCDERVTGLPNGFKIMVEPIKHRRKPSKRNREFILFSQRERCLYCDKLFGTVYSRNGKTRFTKLCWDHYIPYSFSFNNRKTNFVAACHICNGIKSNKMFDTLEEATEYISLRRVKKGFVYFEDL